MTTQLLMLAFFHRGIGTPPEAVPLETFAPPPENWSENNRKISIAKEICITIDFAPQKKFLEESQNDNLYIITSLILLAG